MPAVGAQVKLIPGWQVSAERFPWGTSCQTLNDFQTRLLDTDSLLGGLGAYLVQVLNINTRIWPLGTPTVKSDMLWIPCWTSTFRISRVGSFQSLTWDDGNLETRGKCFSMCCCCGVCPLVGVLRLFCWHVQRSFCTSFISYDTMPRFQWHDDISSNFKNMIICTGTAHPFKCLIK